MSDERMKVLGLLADGKINADEAAKLLDALNRPEHSSAQEFRNQIDPLLSKVAQTLDHMPEQMVNEHLPRIGKGVGRVVEALSGILNQGLGLIETYLQPTFTSEHTLAFGDLEGVTTLEVQNTHGRITVIGEDERQEVSVRVLASLAAENPDAARALFTENPVTLRREGGQLKIAPPGSLAPARALGAIHRHRFDFEIRVPRHLTPYLSSFSGEMRLEGLRFAGRGHAKTFAGDVTVRDTQGDLETNTVSGDISATGSQGFFDFKSVSGDIDVVAPSCSGKFATVSGDLSLEGTLNGETRLKTISGDVELRVVAQGELSASSTSGDLEVDLQPGSQGYVDAATRSGDLTGNIPLMETISGKRHIKGRLGDALHALNFSSISGDIALRAL